MDVDWKLACSGAELKSFRSVFRIKSEELNQSPKKIGIGSEDTSRSPNGGVAGAILTYFQVTQPGSGTIKLLYLLKRPKT